MTSSARASSVGGTSRPSAFAVFGERASKQTRQWGIGHPTVLIGRGNRLFQASRAIFNLSRQRLSAFSK